MKEVWKPIEGHPGYEVSNLGRVRIYKTGYPDADGYLSLSGGKRGAKPIKIHQAVARAFLGPQPQGTVVRHLNDDRRDNRASNLAYGTRKENAADAKRNGRLRHLYSREQLAHLRSIAPLGGNWWKGKKRAGLRGRAVL